MNMHETKNENPNELIRTKVDFSYVDDLVHTTSNDVREQHVC